MSRFYLNQEEYDLLKEIDLSEIRDSIVFSDESNSFEIDDVDTLLIIIDEQITMHGLTADQESVNEYGRKLYNLYDSIFEQ